MWRQDLPILSPEGPRDNTCQLRLCHCGVYCSAVFCFCPRVWVCTVAAPLWGKSTTICHRPSELKAGTLTTTCARCSNTQPLLCNEMGPFQVILGNFPPTTFAVFKQFWAVSRSSQVISQRRALYGPMLV